MKEKAHWSFQMQKFVRYSKPPLKPGLMTMCGCGIGKSYFMQSGSGDCDTAAAEMNRLLRKTISYHDYKEDFYHAFFAGIFAGAGYVVESNKEHGEGRSDVIVYAPSEGQAAVFEIKYSKDVESLSKDCNAALRQIDTRMYSKELEDDYDQVLCYGISFFKKRCVIRKKS